MTDKLKSKMDSKFTSIITEENFPRCEREFKDVAGLYREAGEEIVLGKRACFDELIPKEYYQYTYEDEAGERQVIRKEWDDRAQKQLDELNKRIRDQFLKHHSDRGTLWAILIGLIGKGVMDIIKLNGRTALDEARSKKDTFALWNLLRNACMRLAKTRQKSLEEAYDAVRQGKYRFSEFVVYHRDHMEAVMMAGKEYTDREKALHLVDRCNLTQLKEGYPKVFTCDREGHNYPSYNRIIKHMSRYQLNTSQSKSSDKGKDEKKDRKPDADQPNSKGKKRKSDEISEDKEAFMKIMAATVQKLGWTPVDKKKGKDKAKPAAGTAANSAPGKDMSWLLECACWNCRVKGHLTHKCTKAKTKCTKCGHEGHFAEFCELATASRERYEASKRDRKVAAGKSFKVISDETVSEPEPEEAKETHRAASLRVVPPTILEKEGHLPGDFLRALTHPRAFAVKVIEDSGAVSETEGGSTPAPFLPEDALVGEDASFEVQHESSSSEESSSGGESSSSGDSSSGSSRSSSEDSADPNCMLFEDAEDLGSVSGDPQTGTEDMEQWRDADDLEDGEEFETDGPKLSPGTASGDSVIFLGSNVDEPVQKDPLSVTPSTPKGSRKKTQAEQKKAAKAAAAQKETKAAQDRYREPAGDNEHESSQESEEELYFSDARSCFYGFPTSETDPDKLKAQADATKRHFEVDKDNLPALMRYMAICSEGMRYTETVLSLLNVQIDKSKIPVSHKAARKHMGVLYHNLVDKKWPTGKYPTVKNDPDGGHYRVKKWLNEIWTAMVMRQSDLRATAATVDECFESNEARHLWQNLTNCLNPMLPPKLIKLGTSADPHFVPGVGPVKLANEPETPPEQQLVNLFTTDKSECKDIHPVRALSNRPKGAPTTEADKLLVTSERSEAGALWKEVQTTRKEDWFRDHEEKPAPEKPVPEKPVPEKPTATVTAPVPEGQVSADIRKFGIITKALSKANGKKAGKPEDAAGLEANGQTAAHTKTSKKPDLTVQVSKGPSRSNSSTRVSTRAAIRAEKAEQRSQEPDESTRAVLVEQPITVCPPDQTARVALTAGARRSEPQHKRQERTRQEAEEDRARREARSVQHNGRDHLKRKSPPAQHDERSKHRREEIHGPPNRLSGTLDQRSEQYDQIARQRDRDRERSDSRGRHTKYTPSRVERSSRDSRGSDSGRSAAGYWQASDNGGQRRDRDRPRDDRTDRDRGRDSDRDRPRERDQDRDRGRDRDEPRDPRPGTRAQAPEPVRALVVEDIMEVFYRLMPITHFGAYGLTLRPILVGSKRLMAAQKTDGTALSETHLLSVLRTIQDPGSSSTDQERMVATISHEAIREMQLEGVPMVATEQAHARTYAATVAGAQNAESGQEGVVVDSGASVTLIRNTDGLNRYRLANRRRLRIQTASGHIIGTEEVGTVPGLGTIAVSSTVSDNLLSVNQLCRNTRDVILTFQGDTGTITHPRLTEPLVVHLVDNQYVLTQADFLLLQEAIAHGTRHSAFSATAVSESSELESSAHGATDQPITATDVTTMSVVPIQMAQPQEQDANQDQTEDAGQTDVPPPVLLVPEPGIQQILHDTEVAVPLTPEQLRRAREDGTF